MLVVQGAKKLVVDTPLYPDILRAIPHAKAFQHEGRTLLALNHGPVESIVLRNMGFDVPSPILTHYAWPARFPPMPHQNDTSAFLVSNRRALCLNSPGTGKTVSALWAADYLLAEGVAKKVLIIAPLSTLKPVWGTEIRHHMPHRTFAIITGSRQKRAALLAQPGLEIAIINHDGFTFNHSLLNDFNVVIYDEATALKTPSSQRFRIFNKWVMEHDPWLWLLTGTPISQNPTDAWTLARLVGSPAVPRSFTAFRDLVMNKVTTFKWVPRPDALDTCKKVLQPSIRFALEDCKALPETLYIGRYADLSVAQAKAFKSMEETAVAFFSAGDVAAANAAVMLSKLLQICCGVVYDNQGGSIAVDDKPRYDCLTELIDEIGDKVIVFVPLRGVIDRLQQGLEHDGYSVATVHGDVSKTARDKIFHDFQNASDPAVLLAHPRVAAHGLTLTRSSNVIWYAPIYSLEQYEQANARIRRLTTKGKTAVWHVYSTPFEKELYRRLQYKKRVLGEFLNMVRGINADDDV